MPRPAYRSGYTAKNRDTRGGNLILGGLGSEYRKLWTASTVSNLGDGVTLVAGPLLAASLTRDPVLVAGLTFAQRLPWLLFSLPGGALVDRLDRRLVMVAMDALRTVAIGFLGIAVLLDFASIPLMYVVFFAMGTAETLFDGAAMSVVPALVPEGSLERANGRLMGARIVSNELAAPPLGGMLFAASAAAPFLLDAGTYAAAAALVLAMRGKFRAERPRGAAPTTLRAEITEGLRWLWDRRLFRTLALSLGIMNVTLTAALSIMVLFAQERLGLGPVGYGVLLASTAVGGILGSLVAERVIGRLGPGTTMRVGLLIEATTHLVIALSQNAFVVGTVLALFGFHALVWNVVGASLLQEIVPSRLMGRVNGAFGLFAIGGMSLGALLGGLLAKGFGLTAPFWFAFVLVSSLIIVAWPTLSNRTVAEAREDARGS